MHVARQFISRRPFPTYPISLPSHLILRSWLVNKRNGALNAMSISISNSDTMPNCANVKRGKNRKGWCLVYYLPSTGRRARAPPTALNKIILERSSLNCIFRYEFASNSLGRDADECCRRQRQLHWILVQKYDVYVHSWLVCKSL